MKKTPRKKKAVKKKIAKGREDSVKEFTFKQQRFIDCYNGDIKKAAKKAGISYDYGRQLYTKSHILEAIKHRQDTEIRPKAIMTRQQRQQFWSDVADDEDVDMKDRLRASELLGKSEADFTENLSHKFPEGCGVMVVGGNMSPEQWKKQSEKHHENGSSDKKH